MQTRAIPVTGAWQGRWGYKMSDWKNTAATIGRYLPIPIINRALQIPEAIHEQNLLENVQNSQDRASAPAPHEVFPGAVPQQPQGRGQQGATSLPVKGNAHSLLTGQPIGENGPNVQQPLPANFQQGQPLPRPEQPTAAGPPAMVGPDGKNLSGQGFQDYLNRHKLARQAVDSFNAENMRYLDPQSRQEIHALKAEYALKDGNYMGTADQLVRAGMGAPQALGFVQNQQTEKAFGDAQQKLLQVFDPAGKEAGSNQDASQENYLRAGMKTALGIKDPQARAKMIQMVTQTAKGLPKQSILDNESASGAVQKIRDSITPDSSPQDIHAILADERQALSPSARPVFDKAISPVINQERSMGKDQLNRTVALFQSQALPYTRQMTASQMMDWWGKNSSHMSGSMLTKLEPWVEKQMSQKLQTEGHSGGDALKLYTTFMKNPNVSQVLKSQPYWNRLNSTYKDAMNGNPMAQVPFLETYVRMFSDQALRQYLLSKNIDVQSLGQKIEGHIQKIKDGGAGFTKASMHQMFHVASDANAANRATIMPFLKAFKKAAKEGGPGVAARFDAMTGGFDQGQSAPSGSPAPAPISLPKGALPGSFRGKQGYILNGRFYAQEQK